MKNKVVEEMSSSSFSSFVASGASLCISCKISVIRRMCSKPPLTFLGAKKSVSTISNGADDIIGRSGALPCICGFFCLTHGR